MQEPSELEIKLRRSSVDGSLIDFRDCMEYAGTVSDEMNVYLHMEERKIGLNEPLYWVARLNILKSRCQFVQIAKLMCRIRRNHALKKASDYWRIDQFENEVCRHLTGLLRSKHRGKRRKAEEFQKFSFSNVVKERRIVGDVEVFVDPDCRSAYLLDDYSEFVQRNMAEHCEGERRIYDQRQAGLKKLSFIGQKIQMFNAFSEELLKKRKSERRSANLRLQNISQNAENFQTPKNSVNKIKTLTKSKDRDSIEILRSIKENKKPFSKKDSPRFGADVNKFMIIETTPISFENHKVQDPEKQVHRQLKDKSFDQFAFSFACSSHDGSLDEAILYSFKSIEDSSINRLTILPEKQDIQLGLMIKLAQKQRQETQTLSQIDSNQENCDINSCSDFEVVSKSRQGRSPFKVLFHQAEISDLIELNQQNDANQQNKSEVSQVDELELAQFFSTEKKNQRRQSQFWSQRASFLSLINEQLSCSHSETKHHSRKK